MSTASRSSDIVRIGTRGSPLALAQANMVRDGLLAAHAALEPDQVEIVPISTKGDRVTDRPLAELGGKGLFTAEIESALLSGELAMAVHSMKDMPTVLPDGLTIDCILPREDPSDSLISHAATSLEGLPQGATIGTASLRRQAQIRRLRPDFAVVPLRGNVGTRLEKLERGEVQATFLATAGLKRLGIQNAPATPLPTSVMLPAVAQGAIGVESRTGDTKTAELLSALNDAASRTRVIAERAFLRTLDGSCRTPIAGLAHIDGDILHFEGEIILPDGSRYFSTARSGPVSDADVMGADAGMELKKLGGSDFFAD